MFSVSFQMLKIVSQGRIQNWVNIKVDLFAKIGKTESC